MQKKQPMAGARVAYVGVMIALAMILSYLESFVPLPIGIPGVKLGIANLVVLVTLGFLSYKEVAAIDLLRIVLSGILFGSGVSLAYSLSGGILSLILMLLLDKSRRFSLAGISIAGGVSHNIGQIIMAALLLENKQILSYLPVLLIAGLVTGLINGAVALPVTRIIHKNYGNNLE